MIETNLYVVIDRCPLPFIMNIEMLLDIMLFKF